MSSTEQRPTMAELRRLEPLSDLDRKTLHQIANQAVITQAYPGEVLLARGSNDDNTLYLLEGRLQLTATDGKVSELDHHAANARSPIARLRPSRYEVKALSAVNYLRIDNRLLDALQPQHESTLLDSYEVSEDAEFTAMPADNRLMIKIYQDLNEDRLSLPTLPQVAVRISRAMKDPDLSADSLAKIISADPAIAAKLLRAANSPRFGGRVAINSLTNAVARLGLTTTHTLVLSFAVQELFRTGSDTLKKRMRELWRHSRRVAAVCHVLASKVDCGLDAGFGLLAGLLHDIGVIAVLGYARECPDLTQDPAMLDEAIVKLRSQLGGAIVRRWHLPEELALVAQEADTWLHDVNPHPDYVDLVIIAQLHCFVGTDRMHELPRIDQVPAYAKLALGKLTPDFSLHLLEEAGEEIREVEELLGD